MQKDENVGKEYIEQFDRFVGEIFGFGDIDEEKKTCRKDLEKRFMLTAVI